MKSKIKGIGFLILAMLIVSSQNIAVKWLSGDYSVLEIIAVRSLVSIPTILVIYRIEGQRGLPKTQDLKLESLRGLFLFLSYTAYMIGLAALPLADVEAIRYSSPLMITMLSILFLREKVVPGHWFALLIGFLGVLLIVRPGTTRFDLGSFFILLSVLSYAMMTVFTRKLQEKDSSATMSFYSSLVYLVAVLLLSPLSSVLDEKIITHPSIAFLVRQWSIPEPTDFLIMASLGLVGAGWMYFVARAYSIVQASVLAPFEYLSLPINVMWGYLIWQEIPSAMTVGGAVLTLLSGLYTLKRQKGTRTVQD